MQVVRSKEKINEKKMALKYVGRKSKSCIHKRIRKWMNSLEGWRLGTYDKIKSFTGREVWNVKIERMSSLYRIMYRNGTFVTDKIMWE